jgi:hypothetical protein
MTAWRKQPRFEPGAAYGLVRVDGKYAIAVFVRGAGGHRIVTNIVPRVRAESLERVVGRMNARLGVSPEEAAEVIRSTCPAARRRAS